MNSIATAIAMSAKQPRKNASLLGSMCEDSGIQYAKREQTANLEGHYALITGARVKIGFQASLESCAPARGNRHDPFPSGCRPSYGSSKLDSPRSSGAPGNSWARSTAYAEVELYAVLVGTVPRLIILLNRPLPDRAAAGPNSCTCLYARMGRSPRSLMLRRTACEPRRRRRRIEGSQARARAGLVAASRGRGRGTAAQRGVVAAALSRWDYHGGIRCFLQVAR